MNTNKPIRIRVEAKQMTRTEVVNPHGHIPFRERLARAGAVDLRNNYREEVLPSGYTRLVAIDESKRLRPKQKAVRRKPGKKAVLKKPKK